MSFPSSFWLVAATCLTGCASQLAGETASDDALITGALRADEQTAGVLGDWIALSRAGTESGGAQTPATTTPSYVFPQGVYDNGPLIRAPHVRPVVFAGDEAADTIVASLRSMAKHRYWNDSAAEYGIGALSVGDAIKLSAPAASVTTRNVGTLVAEALAERGEAVDENTLYALYYPAQSTVHRSSDGAVGCEDFAAFHASFSMSKNGATKNYGYAVMPRCGASFSIDEMMISSSHEIFEWATDPFPATNKEGSASYRRLDDAHFAFQLFAGGGELTDVCPGLGSNSEQTRPAGLGFAVARHLSNRAAAAGRFPCGPGPAQPYLVAIPETKATATFRHGRKFQVPVVELPSNQNETTTSVFIHSDTALPASECWSLDTSVDGVVSETSTSSDARNVYSILDPANDAGLELSTDSFCVRAGDVVQLKVRRTRNPTRDSRVLLRMHTRHENTWNSWPFLVSLRK